MARHYLDHASSSPPRPEVGRALAAWSTSMGADPGRVHHEGAVVREALEQSRQRVAELLGVRARRVVFTSGGTEAIHAAVFGATQLRPGRPILCAAVEHSAVRESSARWASVETLAVDHRGRLDLDSLSRALTRPSGHDAALVHCQWANHEVGTLQPVAEVVVLCREAGVPVHVDACAAAGHLPLDLGALGADLVSISAHKLGGPPGVGVLVAGRGTRFPPLLVGGQQERARRAGMENVPGILALGEVAGALGADDAHQLRWEEDRARGQVAKLVEWMTTVEGVELIGDPDPAGRLPHLVCLGVQGVEAEPIVVGLDRRGVALHSGSACSSEEWEPSPVLAAMGADPNHSLRPSVGWCTEDRDVDALAEAFIDVVGDLRQLRR